MKMIDYEQFYGRLAATPLASWLDTLPAAVEIALDPERHGRLPGWLDILKNLPHISPSMVELKDEVRIGTALDISPSERQALETRLRQLHPWRKGPFSLFDIFIDTEWRSDWKWDRLKDAIQPLSGRSVLDVGCGNGYHCWRMIGAGADLVIGLDPYLLYVMQFWAVRHFTGDLPLTVLPLGVEALPANLRAFDTVFSMGVLYHRRDPFEHLRTLHTSVRPGGELVLETLVIDGGPGEILRPNGRYAQMRNVHAIPSLPALTEWLKTCQYRNIQVVDVTPTTIAEQRSTDWMRFHSLPDFLDPQDASRTVEGYPAPQRAVVTAVVPG